LSRDGRKENEGVRLGTRPPLRLRSPSPLRENNGYEFIGNAIIHAHVSIRNPMMLHFKDLYRFVPVFLSSTLKQSAESNIGIA
jgi:hypothetical protein